MKVSARNRGLLALLGFGVYWAAGYTASILYLSPDRPSITCASTSSKMCATTFILTVIAAIGFWTAIIAGVSLLAEVLEREFRKKKTMLIPASVLQTSTY